MSVSARAEGQAALQALDRAIAAKPRGDGPAFAEMTGHLCTMRDVLIARLRADPEGDRDKLGRLNAIISTALAGHFPLGKIPWQEVEHARGMLEALIAEA